ncbi:P-loop NTPase [Couchioplanes azureus]|uniref:P-loop NTPase n=1 Tax=Couchioplanes caeruleus TaxID=56438 RepID=UPI001670C96C|nr:hypothetical protein [Couchioplanes caeruleus]GGQ79578.1 hypothetical protein GCM10010166_57050 [Couchioplanes caeruleus subsp. azureus]
MASGDSLNIGELLDGPGTPAIPDGWAVCPPSFFAGLTPESNLTKFFNGGDPYWEAVVNPGLVRIQLTRAILERTRRRINENKTGIELVIGPTGEGKSTAIRQAAAILGLEDSRTVLWREQGYAILDESVLAAARALGANTVLVSDDAHLVLQPLNELVMNGSVPREGLQILLASRDTDWIRQRRVLGFKLDPKDSWTSKLPLVSTKHPFGRVTEDDARKIVRSWRTLEPDPPSTISNLDDVDAAKLLSEASTGADPENGALLGGLLKIRYTPEELRAHLRDLLESLSQDATESPMTLADVVFVLALVNVAGIDGVPTEVVARFCGVDQSLFRRDVANRLGREAVANYSDDVMRTRHPTVASTIVEIAMSHDSDIAAEASAFHLLAAVEQAGSNSQFRVGYGQLFGLGRKLYKAAVPATVAPQSRALGIALARRVCELRPKTLANYMALSECLRLEKQAPKALTTVWAPLADELISRGAWEDWNKNCRTAVNEFAITASLCGDEREAAIIRMAALSDIYQANRLEYDKVSFSMRGLVLHFSRLYHNYGQPWAEEALGEINGCLAAFFPESYPVEHGTEQPLTPFTTAGTLIRQLNALQSTLRTHESDYLDIPLWVARSTFSELDKFLTKAIRESHG